MSRQTRITSVAALFAATLFTASIPMVAHAGSTRSVAVHSKGLDLTTAAGQERLQRRVERAIEAVCAPKDYRTPEAARAYRACAAEARTVASQQVEAAVAAANSGKNVASSSHTPAVR
jgi:UrcA family protein